MAVKGKGSPRPGKAPPASAGTADPVDALVSAWRRNAAVTEALLAAIPDEGLLAVPAGSRGRSVGRQLAHVAAVRAGWVHHHATGLRPTREGDGKAEPARERLEKDLAVSAEAVAAHLAKAFRGEARIRMFGRDPARFLLYLVSHEAHHRGQIALALKQAGHRLPEKVALQGLWGRWIFGS